jgi:hypothetical protein
MISTGAASLYARTLSKSGVGRHESEDESDAGSGMRDDDEAESIESGRTLVLASSDADRVELTERARGLRRSS